MNWRDSNLLYRWSMTDAEWWQFWRPQSGPIGGAIFAVVLTVVAEGFLWLLP